VAGTHVDRKTHVYWGQSGCLFADIRIPAVRPDCGHADCLQDLSDDALRHLIQAEGFAGTTTLDVAQCTWNREINWQGPTSSVGAGTLRFENVDPQALPADDSDESLHMGATLIETGVHADYHEEWAWEGNEFKQAMRISVGPQISVLLYGDDRFLYGIGKSVDNSAVTISTEDLLEQLVNGYRTEELVDLFSSEYCIGHWRAGLGLASLCTNPLREGQIVLGKKGRKL